jgi:hypothetical protein
MVPRAVSVQRTYQRKLPERAAGSLSYVGNGPANGNQNRASDAIETALGRPPSRRNPFPGESFFMVPIALYESGFSRWMRPSQFIRYVTLLRVANYYSTIEISMDLRSLERLDGVSTRAARDAHIKLQEYGLIRIARKNPFTYTLISPAFWAETFGGVKPIFKRGRSLHVQTEWT